ncbi:hypothetical protein TIFTF001_010250 [Ficus carica]|uniref:Uncharacterized protein n=1 Tax=Ficus carica TaxID=3494 RepID=A0AA88D395_FICCA|nr:hypothetical protein TIFTF001_010250 [Ficus carica]
MSETMEVHRISSTGIIHFWLLLLILCKWRSRARGYWVHEVVPIPKLVSLQLLCSIRPFYRLSMNSICSTKCSSVGDSDFSSKIKEIATTEKFVCDHGGKEHGNSNRRAYQLQ